MHCYALPYTVLVVTLATSHAPGHEVALHVKWHHGGPMHNLVLLTICRRDPQTQRLQHHSWLCWLCCGTISVPSGNAMLLCGLHCPAAIAQQERRCDASACKIVNRQRRRLVPHSAVLHNKVCNTLKDCDTLTQQERHGDAATRVVVSRLCWRLLPIRAVLHRQNLQCDL